MEKSRRSDADVEEPQRPALRDLIASLERKATITSDGGEQKSSSISTSTTPISIKVGRRVSAIASQLDNAASLKPPPHPVLLAYSPPKSAAGKPAPPPLAPKPAGISSNNNRSVIPTQAPTPISSASSPVMKTNGKYTSSERNSSTLPIPFPNPKNANPFDDSHEDQDPFSDKHGLVSPQSLSSSSQPSPVIEPADSLSFKEKLAIFNMSQLEAAKSSDLKEREHNHQYSTSSMDTNKGESMANHRAALSESPEQAYQTYPKNPFIEDDELERSKEKQLDSSDEDGDEDEDEVYEPTVLGRAMSVNESEMNTLATRNIHTVPPPSLPPRPNTLPEPSATGATPPPRLPPRPTGAAIDRVKAVATTVKKPSDSIRPELPSILPSGTDLSEPPLPPRPLARSGSLARSTSIRSTATFSSSSNAESGSFTLMAETFPDVTASNRNPPDFSPHKRLEVQSRANSRSLAVAGSFVVTGTHSIRVWDLNTGENIHVHTYKNDKFVTSLGFRPARNPEEEGRYVWCGMSDGGLIAMDCHSGTIVESRSTAHSKAVNHILRYQNSQLWTLDDNGVLQVWSDKEAGYVSLERTGRQFRVALKQNVALVAGDHLWTASGRTLEVFDPVQTGSMVIRPIQLSMGIGNITTMTCLGSNVYIGHDDGKVSVWDARSCVKNAIVPISIYGISCLLGVGDYLWAGFNTGKIYVYDMNKAPWLVVKDWKAHSSTVQTLQLDYSSLLKSDRFQTEHRLQVASMSDQGNIKMWDGLMGLDWRDAQMRLRESDYCSYRDLRVLLCSWNVDACKPYDLEATSSDFNFLKQWLTPLETPDIISIGFQEIVNLESKKNNAKVFLAGKKKNNTQQEEEMTHRCRLWHDRLVRALRDYFPGESYTLIKSADLMGLFSCIFIRDTELPHLRDKGLTLVKTGLKGYHGNKGGIIVRMVIEDTSICFVNCHLAAGQSHTRERNNDSTTILETADLDPRPCHSGGEFENVFVGGGDGSMVLDHEICFLSGDLNYRIDMKREAVISKIMEGDFVSLLEHDQLVKERMRNPLFRLRAFSEGPIDFAPTYKYDPGYDQYDTSEKRRVPAWCDRILYRGKHIQQHFYRRFECRISDHRPIGAGFTITIKRVVPKKRSEVKMEVEAAWCTLLDQKVREAKVHWLEGHGFGREESKNALERCSWGLDMAMSALTSQSP
ncbi:uncharacterized protein VTP21DRAFT_7900 [Calcarisporiella thermophila]|uniref:uncharacterized protein n=1 Tax=Calcarisporiella thermophila TaxID=911321 RepID=UPI0037422192